MTDLTEQQDGRWQRFKVWLHGFEIYQIFVVRAWKRQTSKGWYVLMLIQSAIVYFCLCFWLQHAATLDELRKESGVVEAFGIGRNCSAGLTLRTDDGTLYHYHLCEPDKQRPQRVIGKQATVWSESTLIPPIVWGGGKAVVQLQVGTVLEIRFDPQNAERMKRIYERVIKFFLPFVLIPLFRIWWVNRKE
jgi:hypothetical protein